MNSFISAMSGFFFNYWVIVLIFVLFGAYWIFQRKKAEQILLGLMLRAEKEAEALLLQTGDQKFEWVIQKGWELLPEGARVFIPKLLFVEIAQTLYNKAKDYANLTDPPKPIELSTGKCDDNKCSQCTGSANQRPTVARALPVKMLILMIEIKNVSPL
ncbi:MAG: hypothetical protein ACYDEJ_09450 [Desulfitobacteriaceae bacterium]